MNTDPLERLDAAMSDVSDVYIIHGADAEAYLTDLEANLRKAICVPFEISAVVMEPRFDYASVGTIISGQCVAHAGGYWLVYQTEHNKFLFFWGSEPGKLGAPGISGSPLGCWSA